MRKLKINYNFVALFIIFTSYFVLPFLGQGFKNHFNNNLNQKETLDLKNVFFPLNKPKSSYNYNPITGSGIKPSIFDKLLNEYLSNITLFEKTNLQDIKAIILFENEISKQERINIIDSVFKDYKILSNFDIIPGTSLQINPSQLISSQGDLEETKGVIKVYKSITYKNPYIIEDTLQINSLNSDSYPNWWLSAIGADNLTFDGTGVRVAVIDTGIYDHLGLNIVENQNFVFNESTSNYNDDVGHGTHVAGIIGGDGTGSSGEYRGVAPGVSIINARAGNNSGLEEDDIIKAIEWSSKPIDSAGAGADIISMSFGGGNPDISDLITQAISNAKNNYGVIFVASAGNSGPEYFTGSTPASGIDVISVGATDEDDQLASFSSWGPAFGYLGYPDFVAPGVNIISAEAPDSTISKDRRYRGDFFDFSGDADYMPLSGTSMSCPIVAGALAILKEAFPYMTPETARIALLEGARKLSNEDEDNFLKSGAGLINISASLDYLKNSPINYNDTAKIFPDELPIKPFDLLHFPGDHQKFNLTIISGKSNTFNIEIPSIQGVSIFLDKSSLIFSDAGIGFVELEVIINKEAIPGIRNFQISLKKGSQIYDIVNVALDIRLPEYKILMESYHGLNDWFPTFTFDQMGFYEAMADISEMNISVDYSMEYWTPDYDKDYDNSILTEERLAQYDLVILQNPILPYSPLEINNIKEYFDNGGNILFLGTRYQDMVVDNINSLFSFMDTGIQINEENVMDDSWLGIGASVESQDVINFNNPIIFKNVSKFEWVYGNSFTVSGDAKSIATLSNKTVVAMYNGTSEGKGRFLAFGDLFWIYTDYKSSDYSLNHSKLLNNVMEYLLPKEDVSINIDLNYDRISNPNIEISVYLKNQTTKSPLTNSDYSSLSLTIKNGAFLQSISINTAFNNEGIYFNNLFNLPNPSYLPYSVIVNLTINSKSYSKIAKILYFDKTIVPKINDLLTTKEKITRSVNNSTNIIGELDRPTYGSIDCFLSIYSYSFYNTKKSINKTLTLSHSTANYYIVNFDPEITDPSGYAIFYILPTNLNYINPNSPRYKFQVINKPPEILNATSSFNFGGNSDILFENTESDDGSFVYSTSRGTKFNFKVDVNDSVDFEDNQSSMRVFINLFICSVTEDGYLMLIFPSSIEVSELIYRPNSDKHEGAFTIPNSMKYSSISGTKSISTAASYDDSTKKGYLGILLITVHDSEGEYEEFIIILLISKQSFFSMDTFSNYWFIWIPIAIIGISSVTILSVYFVKRGRRKRNYYTQPSYREYSYPTLHDEPEDRYSRLELDDDINQTQEFQIGNAFYCAFCGKLIKTPKKFCPHCGESVKDLMT